MRRRIVPTLLFAVVTLVVAACGGASDTGSGTKVVAAFYPLEFLAQTIAPGAEVTNVTPAGAEPHDLELTPRDVETLESADLVLYLGSGFQPALEAAVSGKASALDLLAGQDLMEGSDAHGHGDEHEDEVEHEGTEDDHEDRAHGDDDHDEQGEDEAHGDDEHGDESGLDPHVWLDPMRFAAMAKATADALAEPEAADDLVADLEELAGEFRRGLAACERRVIVTSHAAFGYLASAYDLEQIALNGLSPEAEPSPRDLEELIDEVKEEGATTVFYETLVSPGVAETVARESGATTAVLNPLEGLTEAEAEDGADYFSVMRANLEALRQALGCT